jgi:hypothetical protein
MNRREFFATIGVGAAGLLVDPREVVAAIMHSSNQYPPLYWTGYRKQIKGEYCGQLLWAVAWEAVDGRTETTLYYVNSTIYEDRDTRENIEYRSSLALDKARKMIDGIIEQGHQGTVEAFLEADDPDFDHKKVGTQTKRIRRFNLISHQDYLNRRPVEEYLKISYESDYRETTYQQMINSAEMFTGGKSNG